MKPARLRTAALASALATVLAAAACASAGNPAPSSDSGSGESTQSSGVPAAQIAVKNENNADVTVYVVTTDESYRVGAVTSYDQRLFTLPPRFLLPGQQPRIVAVPLAGSENYASQPLLFGPGDTIVLEVGSWIRQSSVRVVKGS